MRNPLLPISLSVIALFSVVADASDPQIAFGPDGLQSLSIDGVQLLRSPEPRITRIVWDNGELFPIPGNAKFTAIYDLKTQHLEQTYEWCKIALTYKATHDRLSMRVTLTNTAHRIMRTADLRVLQLQFPQKPKGPGWYQDLHTTAASVDDAAVILADYGTGTAVAVSETFEPENEIAFEKVHGKEQNLYGLDVRPIARTASDFIHVDQPALAPGNSITYELSLRFGPAGAGLKALAADVFTKYASAHPPVLKWPDRRPIAMLMLASAGAMHHSAENPRGWLSDPKIDVTTPEGKAGLKQKCLAWADRCVKECKSRDAQGVIVWDIEGEQFNSITYVGDPRMLPEISPEMDAIADGVFKKFLDAGLKTGVCIRPSRIVRNDTPDAKCPWKHVHMNFDPAEEMSHKIAYAKKRWGCTLFYMDSNATYAFTEKQTGAKDQVTSWVIRADTMRRLAEKQPGVLILPEFQYAGYFSHVSGYRELRGGIASTSTRVLAAYPDAFTVINTGDGKLDERHADLVAAVKRGDILMFRGWFNSSENATVQAIYEEAKGK